MSQQAALKKIDAIKTLGRYEILSELGRGGMGIVYKAVDSFLERTVALKVADISSLEIAGPDKNKLDRCLKEARLAAQFIHPNIAITYDAGIEEGLFYIALECIDGSGLQRHTSTSRLLPQRKVLEVIYNACYALDYIHRKGYVHLDIKPANIMLTRRDEVKLMDFGISRFFKEEEKPEGGLKLLGTPAYMSPEQTGAGAGIDHQSDIFSLGIVLYELLSGKKPFAGNNHYETIYQIAHLDPPPISTCLPDISPDLGAVVHRAIRKDKKNRFETAKQFAEALLPLIKGEDSGAIGRQDKKKVAYLKRLTFFKHFQYSELREVVNISSWSVHDKGAWIIQQDQHDNNIYFIVQGKALLHLMGKIRRIEKGECFGETTILYKMPRKARVLAETRCVVMAINAHILKQAADALQVKFLREFYNIKILQLVDANLKMIRAGK